MFALILCRARNQRLYPIDTAHITHHTSYDNLTVVTKTHHHLFPTNMNVRNDVSDWQRATKGSYCCHKTIDGCMNKSEDNTIKLLHRFERLTHSQCNVMQCGLICSRDMPEALNAYTYA